jgi:hypothetical protein
MSCMCLVAGGDTCDRRPDRAHVVFHVNVCIAVVVCTFPEYCERNGDVAAQHTALPLRRCCHGLL